jgi:hypothetical protein
MTATDLTVTLRVKDEVTPVLNRIQRRLWWMDHGESVMRGVMALLMLATFILGRITA